MGAAGRILDELREAMTVYTMRATGRLRRSKTDGRATHLFDDERFESHAD
jgi:hypothetical protein